MKTPRGTIDAADWWRLMTPAWPAFLLLMCSLPLLVPSVGGRLAARFPAEPGPARDWSRPVRVLLGVAALVPLAVMVLPAQRAGTAARIEAADLMVTLDRSIHVHATKTGNKVTLKWTGGTPGTAKVFYRVVRQDTFANDPTERRRRVRAHDGRPLLLAPRRTALRALDERRRHDDHTDLHADAEAVGDAPRVDVPRRGREQLRGRPERGRSLDVQPAGAGGGKLVRPRRGVLATSTERMLAELKRAGRELRCYCLPTSVFVVELGTSRLTR